MELIGERILIEAKAQKISIKALAIKIGMTEAGLYRTIKNNSLKVSTLLDISKVLKIEPAILLNPDYEFLLKNYRELIDNLVDIIIGQISNYGEFLNVLEKFAFKNQEIRKEINKYFFDYYTKQSQKQAKTAGKNLNPRVKNLTDIFYKNEKKEFDKETIKKGTANKLMIELKKNMETAEILLQLITAKDPNFNTRFIEVLYNFYINPS